MEKKNLPNATAVLILGILSIVTCCCYGVTGLIFGIIALVLANKDTKLYNENPELYLNYNNINIGRVLAIIGVTLSGIAMMFFIYVLSLGEEGMKDFMQNLKDKTEQMEREQK